MEFTLKGRVTDEHGDPITGAIVQQSQNRYTSEYQPIQDNHGYNIARTDDHGLFCFENVKSTEMILTVEAAGYAPSWRYVKARLDLEPIKFSLKPGRIIQSKVIDETGVPVVGACVFIDGWHGHSDISGRFSCPIEGASPRQATLRVVKQYHTQLYQC